MAEGWHPTPNDQYMATESYIHYASGVAIIGDPEATRGIHAFDVAGDNLGDIASVAETFMLQGAVGVIRYANPPDIRDKLYNMEHSYEEALLHMRATIIHAYDQHVQRLERLNPMFTMVRPAPMLDKRVYASLCHSRLGKLTIERMMAGFQPSAAMRQITERQLAKT